MTPDPKLADLLLCEGLILPDQAWMPLRGGQTNQLWRVGSAVVKRFAACDGNPKFPNDSMQEVAILRHLQGLGLAQRLLGHLVFGGDSILVYRHLEGESWRADTAQVARALRMLHAVAPPAGLRVQSGGSLALQQQVAAILPDLPTDLAERLQKARPRVAPIKASPVCALLHGDPVPGNIIVTPAGVRLIDWQCPAIGDPVEDLALFLSPAMQQIYRGSPLEGTEIKAFLTAYDDRATIERLQGMQPWHHWAMAAYCAWKTARGSKDYAAAMELELAAL